MITYTIWGSLSAQVLSGNILYLLLSSLWWKHFHGFWFQVSFIIPLFLSIDFCNGLAEWAKGHLISKAKFSQKTNKRICFSILMTWKDILETWILISGFKHIFTSHKDRKTNSEFVCFLGENKTWQFCFEICWPLETSRKTMNGKNIME